MYVFRKVIGAQHGAWHTVRAMFAPIVGLSLALSQPPLSRRAAIAAAAACTQPFRASAFIPIARENAATFGTPESRTGFFDGIKSAFNPSKEDLAAAYAAAPADVSGAVLPPAFAKASDVAIIFHGSGGPDRETDQVAARIRAQDEAAGFKREVLVFDWMQWFTPNTDRLSFQSGAVGSELGKSLATNKGLKSLTIVGTSAGSFAADACCSAYVASAGSDKKQRAAVRLTLADPFAAKEGTSFQAGRGAQYFGKDADFAEHILNTDDIVPNTEVPLPLCYCLDVTGAKERKSFPPPDKTGDLVYDFIVGSLGGHSWPMGYLARHYETKLGAKGQLLLPSHEEMPRGAVVRVA